MPRTPELDHVVLEVRDPERSAVFYQRVLGFAPVRLEEFRAGQAPFVSLRVSAGTVVDLFPTRLWRLRRPQNPHHLCFTFEARSMAALARRLGRLGVRITQRSDRNFGARGFGRSLYFEDPDGISLEVRCYPL